MKSRNSVILNHLPFFYYPQAWEGDAVTLWNFPRAYFIEEFAKEYIYDHTPLHPLYTFNLAFPANMSISEVVCT
jgi:hypothetical protein